MDDMVLATIAQGWIWYVQFLPWTAGWVLIWVAAGRTHGGGELLRMGRVAVRDVECRREGGMLDLRLDLARQRRVMGVMNRGR
ncbi:hypothetical protein ACLOJK_034744 [Asimina triloba]